MIHRHCAISRMTFPKRDFRNFGSVLLLLSSVRGELAATSDVVLAGHRCGSAVVVAKQVPEELSRVDALKAHARDEVGIDLDDLSNPIQAALASVITFASGEAVPLLAGAFITSQNYRLASIVAAASLALLSFGAIDARLGRSTEKRGRGLDWCEEYAREREERLERTPIDVSLKEVEVIGMEKENSRPPLFGAAALLDDDQIQDFISGADDYISEEEDFEAYVLRKISMKRQVQLASTGEGRKCKILRTTEESSGNIGSQLSQARPVELEEATPRTP